VEFRWGPSSALIYSRNFPYEQGWHGRHDATRQIKVYAIEEGARLVAELSAQQAEAVCLDAAITANLKEPGHDA
jgi:hypothetical protein